MKDELAPSIEGLFYLTSPNETAPVEDRQEVYPTTHPVAIPSPNAARCHVRRSPDPNAESVPLQSPGFAAWAAYPGLRCATTLGCVVQRFQRCFDYRAEKRATSSSKAARSLW